MGQIIGSAAKPKRCNLNKLSQLETPAAGEHILVSSDNSMNAAGQGNFDAYVVGDGTTAATGLELKSLVEDGAFDISAYRATGNVLAKYADIAAALDGGNNIPKAFRKGGMSVKFVRSSDNMYVQFRCMAQNFTTDITQWQGVSDKPMAGSENLVKSGGVFKEIAYTTSLIENVNASSTKPFKFLKDVVYYINVETSGKATLSTRAADGTTTVDSINNGNFVLQTPVKFIPTADAEYLRIGSAKGTPLAIKIKAIGVNLNSFVDTNLQKLSAEQKAQALTNLGLPTTVDDTPTIDSNNFVKSSGVFAKKSVIELKMLAGGGFTNGLDIGEYGYNTSERRVYYKKSDNTLSYISPNEHTIYVYNDNYYRYIPGSTADGYMVKCIDVKAINNLYTTKPVIWVNRLKLHNNSLNSSTGGTDNYNAKRVCTGYLKGAFTITLNSPYVLFNICTYDSTTFAFKNFSALNSNIYTSDGTDIIRFVIRNGAAGTNDVSYKDNIVSSYDGNEAFDEDYVTNLRTLNINSNDISTLKFESLLSMCVFEQGGINIAGQEIDLTTRIRTKNYLYGSHTIKLPAGFTFGLVVYYNKETFTFDSYVAAYQNEYTIGKSNCVARFVITKDDRTQDITVDEIKEAQGLEMLDSEINSLKTEITNLIPQPAPVIFDIDHNMKDFTDFHNSFSITPATTIAERIYHLYDELAALYPDYVKKYDPMADTDTTQTVVIDGVSYNITVYGMSNIKSAMSEAGFSDYPVYAKGVTDDIQETVHNIDGTSYTVTYTQTPAYRTYMYAFVCGIDYINTDINKKHKIMVTSNLHGNEVAAVVNLYLLMKQLCDGVVDDGNFYKLRAAFDIYVIPSVNQYGNYHNTRCNARRVDLNRNFPIKNWSISGFNTIDDDRCVFTGSSAGSEFETQLVVALSNYIQPVWAFDHHNYGSGTGGVYSGIVNHDGVLLTKLAQQAAVDIAIADAKNYPEYFGKAYHDVLFGSTADAPGHNASINLGRIHCWWAENMAKMAGLIEVGTSIGWSNGERVAEYNWMGKEVLSINEYIVRIQWLRYLQFLMDNFNMI